MSRLGKVTNFMCGIAGVFGTQPVGAFRGHVERIVESQYRRGPDHQAIEVIGGRLAGVVLGHNRLSIVDVSPAGNQPMWDVDRQICVVLNGEIYNYIELRAELTALGHRFASASDTEVVLEAFKRWGKAAVERFNGMFAFALFDTRDERLHLVRDRFGVKPLYYSVQGDTVHFASSGGEMARLLNLSPNLEYGACGVQYGLYEFGEVAPYVGMKALLPGHWLEIGPGHNGCLAQSRWPYYDLHARVATAAEAFATIRTERAVDTIRSLLDDAVRVRLRSDVPVAVSLSGGLDSSTVAALAAGHQRDVLRGFTFGHPQVAASEGPLAAALGEMAGIEVTFVWPCAREICEAYRDSLQAQAGPFTSGSVIAQYLVFKAARAAGFKVLLGGQGGDEAFMGYRKFQWFQLRRLGATKQYLRAVGFALSLVPTVLAERWRWMDSWSNRHRYLRRSGLTTVLSLPDARLDIGFSPTQPLFERQILDVTLASLPTLLRYEDSNSMGNSIESRLPFLDYRVVELGVALREALKLRGGHGKWVVRRAMAGKLPESIRTARFKRGFDVQQGHWIDEGLGEFIRTMLREQSSKIAGWLGACSNLDEVFSNEELKGRPSRFAEATTLLWLTQSTN